MEARHLKVAPAPVVGHLGSGRVLPHSPQLSLSPGC